ncbi:trypco2 family protein [Streptomyces olivochromogenes]|uniref:trypco2 family protein n=1 Tax=Streptomyces olivochromogenes TaxID=1963 RepID=UPI001F4504CC|nr:trypco2 family protein [Streptomyces olivochromogenes]
MQFGGECVIELSDLIRELRQQLTAAAEEQAGEAVQLELGPIEIEVTVCVTRESGPAGRIRFWVVDAEAEERSPARSGSTQRITLTLQPRTAQWGSPVRVSRDAGPIIRHSSPGPENDPDDDWPQVER